MRRVYCYFVLDILHTGHLLYMRKARDIAGVDGEVIAGILTDNAVMERKSRPVFSFEERLVIAESIKYLDLVVPQYTYSPISNIGNLRPNILLESESHDDEIIKSSKDAIEEINGELIILPYYSQQSSTKIKMSIINSMEG